MQCGDAVGAVAADDGEVGHADLLRVGFLDDAHLGQLVALHREEADRFLQEAAVDFIDDLQMSGKQLLEHREGPFFQCFRHQRVVGVAQRADGDVPCGLPVQVFLVDQ